MRGHGLLGGAVLKEDNTDEALDVGVSAKVEQQVAIAGKEALLP